MSLLSSHDKEPTYFIHLHVDGVPVCFWYVETEGRPEMHTKAEVAYACTMAVAQQKVQALRNVGVSLTEVTFVKCEEANAIMPERIRKLLKLT